MKTSIKDSSPSVLIVGAMDSELSLLLKTLRAVQIKKLLNIFPLYKAEYNSVLIYILKTFVGEHNALLAGYEAIKELNPNLVLKFGAVGGSYPTSKAGDIIVPLGFFHRTAWITRTKIEDKPTSDASEWQSLFGNLPYQVNKENLGGMPYFFRIEEKLLIYCKKSLNKLNMNFKEKYIGGGNIWMFDKRVLNNVANTMLPINSKPKSFVSDMESYSLAHVAYLTHTPFIGCYIVASNDYNDEIYQPDQIPNLVKSLIPYVLELIENFTPSD